eukprot:TRINITY_DN80759_c0_g1_i1.p1 TRINITY_DN80759_c0_g1~~TRINITY_DN80759_c0_g1_i1.p1  ORF type:complete len:601 (+),score=139.03 TRINITY_DN80759_c0_g1_i1:31-1833(+)
MVSLFPMQLAVLLALLPAVISGSSEELDRLSSDLARLRAENDQLRRRLRATVSEESVSTPSASTNTPSSELPVAETVDAAGAEKEEEKEEEGEEGEEGEEEEEEEEEFTPVDIGCSWMLIGSLFFVMVTFYLVNYPDHDIKRYSWSIINTTLSIFSAVLIFTGVDECFIDFLVTPALGAFPTGTAEVIRVLSGFVIFMIWFLVLQLMVAYWSNNMCKTKDSDIKRQWVIADGMRGDHGMPVPAGSVCQVQGGGGTRSIAVIDHVEVFVASKAISKEARERRTKCWATLFAHLAGFAMISAGGDLQHAPCFVGSPAMSWVAVAISAGFLLLLFSISEAFRPSPEGCDEEEAETRELWAEEAKEAEDDLFSLSISFLCVGALKFTITGVLPTKLGNEPGEEFNGPEIRALYGAGLVSCVLMVLCILPGSSTRLSDLAVGTCSMSFAWCTLFGTRWLFEATQALSARQLGPRTIEGRVLLAMALSAFSCFVIIVLDKIEDSLTDNKSLSKIVKNIITGLSILVGFSWEHSFDGAVEAVASLWEDPLLIKVIGTILIALIVIPAWRRYVLQKVVDLMKDQKERSDARRKLKAGYVGPQSREVTH